MRRWCVGLVLALTASGVATLHAAAPVAAAPGRGHLDDPRLIAERDDARREHSRRAERTTAPARVLVEVQTTDTEGVARGLRRVGAEVSGEVPGSVVQALVPVDALETVAAFGAVTDLQYPRRQGYVPTSPVRRNALLPGVDGGFGSTVGEAVIATRANRWHDAVPAPGFTAVGVKVGIVDYFRPDVWSEPENGVRPDAAHQFCKDSLSATASPSNLCNNARSIRDSGEIHGNAVAEIVKDMAPDSELYIASVGTVSDLVAAISWFAANGVTIMTRSLGSAYDGAGDGSGPLGAAVNHAVSRGITWFNSAGNEGADRFLKKLVTATVAVDGGNYVNINDGSPAVSPTVDTWLRVDSFNGGCFFMDGVRWANDWYLGAASRTDYSVEFWQPRVGFNPGGVTSHRNPLRSQVEPLDLNRGAYGNQGGIGIGGNIINRDQRAGAPPLEASDIAVCPSRVSNISDGTSVTYIRLNRRSTTSIGAAPDRMEIAISGSALVEYQYSDRAGSAATPVVDSRNPGLVSVGAVDINEGYRLNAADPRSIAWYSSQGPTTDGRTKPDLSAWAGVTSWTYATYEPESGGVFSGTSAAAPSAAGVAALLKGAGLAATPAALAALVKHQTLDHAPLGPDNAYGFGITRLFDPPDRPAEVASKGRYIPLAVPTRVYDSRPVPGGPPTYSRALGSIINVPISTIAKIPAASMSAVAVNVTSVASRSAGFVQAFPWNRSPIGASSTLNVNAAGQIVPNFSIVPVGDDGIISVYLPVGGHVIVDLMGWFTKNEVAPTDGRYVPLAAPTQVYTGTLSTGSSASVSLALGPFPTGLVPRGQATAVVVDLTAWGGTQGGYLRTAPSGVDARSMTPSNLNLTTDGSQVTNMAIVKLGPDGRIQIYSKAGRNSLGQPVRVTTRLKVDLVGYFTSAGATASDEGTFVPVRPTRMYDSRRPTPKPIAARTARTITVGGAPDIFGAAGPPASAIAYAGNWTVTQPAATGTLSVYAAVRPNPPTPNVSFTAAATVANGALFRTVFVPGTPPATDRSTVNAFMSATGHVIIDINGYFLAATPP